MPKRYPIEAKILEQFLETEEAAGREGSELIPSFTPAMATATAPDAVFRTFAENRGRRPKSSRPGICQTLDAGGMRGTFRYAGRECSPNFGIRIRRNASLGVIKSG